MCKKYAKIAVYTAVPVSHFAMYRSKSGKNRGCFGSVVYLSFRQNKRNSGRFRANFKCGLPRNYGKGRVLVYAFLQEKSRLRGSFLVKFGKVFGRFIQSARSDCILTFVRFFSKSNLLFSLSVRSVRCR